jgi:hypothetical protein
MGEGCSDHIWEIRKQYKILAGSPEGKRPLVTSVKVYTIIKQGWREFDGFVWLKTMNSSGVL